MSGESESRAHPALRPAGPADLSSILEIESNSPSAAHWPESEYRRAIGGAERLVLVAELGANIAGFLVCSRLTEEWELENIAVAPEARLRGVGGTLMRALIACARAGGAREIRQEIRASNLAAQGLGRSVGFKQLGRRSAYYRDPREDGLLFKYLLVDERETAGPGKPRS